MNDTLYQKDLAADSIAFKDPFNLTYNPLMSGLLPNSQNQYQLSLAGPLSKVNIALRNLKLGPLCPFDTALKVQVTVKASPQDKSRPANGQMVSVAAAEAKQI